MDKQITQTKKRNANLDLLRIFSMMLIILLHSVDHSGVLETADAGTASMQLCVRFVYMLTQVCVNCYVLLSGYFLVKSKFRLQKLVALWMEVVFYSFIIKLIFMIVGYRPFSIGSLISCFMPVTTGRYWFITIYFGLYLVSPFLNIAIHAMNKKQHTMLNVLLFFLFSVCVSIHPSIAGMNSGAGWGIAWFIVLYFFAAWFRLYYKPNQRFVGKLLLWIGISVGIAIIYVLGGGMLPLIETIVGNWYRYDSVPACIATLCLFVAFLNINIKNELISKIITTVAPATLGVYLIHAHAEFSPWSWEVLNLPAKMDSVLFFLIQVGVVLAIYTGCTVLDLIRMKTVGRVESNKRIVEICERISKKISDSFDILQSK